MTPTSLASPMVDPPNRPPAPLPAIEPLELLYVTNGSLLTAERWWQAHRYYQHRQNLHYQSLHQPGIVSGLGVRVVPAPDAVPSELRDRRWIEIQPGIAIDLVGNPLVVEEPMTFRITSEVIAQGSASASRPASTSASMSASMSALTPAAASTPASNGTLIVYVVLAYVDPTAKQWQTPPSAVVKEEFRINERITPPDANEVELCRIHLTSNAEPLENAVDVFNPTPQSIDLRYRHHVQARSQHSVQVGVFAPSSRSLPQCWNMLLQSVPGLYPPLASNPTVQSVPLTPPQGPESTIQNLPALTLLVMSHEDAIALTTGELEVLQSYRAQGCTVLVEYDDREVLKHLDGLKTIQTDITAALADLQTLPSDSDTTTNDKQDDLQRIRQELRDELLACQTTFQQQIQSIGQVLERWGQAVPSLSFRPLAPSTSPSDSSANPSDPSASALIQHPYLFDALPHLPTGPVQVLTDNGIILVIGSLSAAWVRQQFESPLPRSTVREAQELGINILHYASSRQQMLQAQQQILQEQ